MRRALLALLPLCLAAQSPAYDAAFFTGDRQAILHACTDKARAIEAKDSRLMAEYGRAYLAAGDRKLAEEVFLKAARLDRVDGETFRLIALAWISNGFKVEAMAALDQLQEADPRNDRSLRLGAIDFLKTGHPQEAEAIMERVLRMAPTDADNCKDFAEAALAEHQGALGDRWAEKAWTLGGAGLHKDWKECLDVALAARRAGMDDLAARWFARTVAARPKEERMWNAVALAFADGAPAGSQAAR